MVALIAGLDEEVEYEPDDQQPRHNVHGDVVGLCVRNAVRNVVLADVVDQNGADNAGRRPGGQQDAMDCADIACAEHVAQIGWYGREASAIHTDDDEEAAYEQDHIAGSTGKRHSDIEDETQRHINEVGVTPPDKVRQRGPAETAAHVEYA